MTPRACRRALQIALFALFALASLAAAPERARAQGEAGDDVPGGADDATPPGPGDPAPTSGDSAPDDPDDPDEEDFFDAEDEDLFTVEDEINPESPPIPLTPPDDDESSDAWSLSFFGAYAVPVGSFADTRSAGLAAALDATWTGAWGIGARAAVQYAPVPHLPVETDEEPTARDGHMFTLALAPAFELRFGDFRGWTAAGGAVVLERLEIATATQAMNDTADKSFELGVAGTAAIGVDYLLFGDGGPSVSTEFVRAIAGNTYGYVSLRAGLAFVF